MNILESDQHEIPARKSTPINQVDQQSAPPTLVSF